MKKPTGKKKIVIIVVIIVAIALAVGSFLYFKNKQNQKTTQGQNSNQDTAKTSSSQASGQKSATSDTKTGSTNSNNTNQTNTDIPTPVLVKSAGNTGPAPAGVLIDFTCFGPSGYSCQLTLKPKSGSAPNFDKKSLTTDSRGQSFANWEWKTVSGSWQAQAVLYNSSGQSKASDPQSFEVKW